MKSLINLSNLIRFIALVISLLAQSMAWAQDCKQSHPRYAGPLSSETRLARDDPYVWFVTDEFAKRFCMPPNFVDPQLKGALAIAVGMVKNLSIKGCKRESTTKVICTEKSELMLDIYYDNESTNIPKADPAVDFYVAWTETSTDALTAPIWHPTDYVSEEGLRASVVRRPFRPAVRNPPGADWTIFHLIGVRSTWASSGGDLIETYYRANWVPGIDVVRLNLGDRYGGMPNPAKKEVHPNDSEKGLPIQRWSIGILKEKDRPKAGGFDPNVWKVIPYPSGYLHVIELPMNLAQLIYEYDKKSGSAFFGEMQQRFERNTGSKAPIFQSPSASPTK
jgi:hypothetical protein